MAVGFDDSKQVFIIRNSWGEKWGDKGYFYMPYEYIKDTNLCSDFWVMKTVIRMKEKTTEYATTKSKRKNVRPMSATCWEPTTMKVGWHSKRHKWQGAQ